MGNADSRELRELRQLERQDSSLTVGSSSTPRSLSRKLSRQHNRSRSRNSRQLSRENVAREFYRELVIGVEEAEEVLKEKTLQLERRDKDLEELSSEIGYSKALRLVGSDSVQHAQEAVGEAEVELAGAKQAFDLAWNRLAELQRSPLQGSPLMSNLNPVQRDRPSTMWLKNHKHSARIYMDSQDERALRYGSGKSMKSTMSSHGRSRSVSSRASSSYDDCPNTPQTSFFEDALTVQLSKFDEAEVEAEAEDEAEYQKKLEGEPDADDLGKQVAVEALPPAPIACKTLDELEIHGEHTVGSPTARLEEITRFIAGDTSMEIHI